MNDKKYCNDCIFFVLGEKIPFSYGPPEYIKEKCLSPNNFKDSNTSPKVLPISTPIIINAFNNCLWFVAKQTESSSSSSSGE